MNFRSEFGERKEAEIAGPAFRVGTLKCASASVNVEINIVTD